jgi:hypothetical protein
LVYIVPRKSGNPVEMATFPMIELLVKLTDIFRGRESLTTSGRADTPSSSHVMSSHKQFHLVRLCFSVTYLALLLPIPMGN